MNVKRHVEEETTSRMVMAKTYRTWLGVTSEGMEDERETRGT